MTIKIKAPGARCDMTTILDAVRLLHPATEAHSHEKDCPICAAIVQAEREPTIVGWVVFGDDTDNCAMYNLSERDEAFDAAKRWGCRISAVVIHPDSPDITARGAT